MVYSKQRAANSFILFLSITYFVSYITRINYGTIIAELVTTEGIPKSLASLAITGSSVAYGLGQLLSGWLGDRLQPKWLLFSGLFVTVCMNILMPYCATPYLMTVVWSINGLSQAFMWPPMVRLMSAKLEKENYIRACVNIAWGGSIGTVFMYLTAPVMIRFWGWRSVFFISAGIAIVMMIVWVMKCPIIEQKRVNIDSGYSDAKPSDGKTVTPAVILMGGGIMLSIMLQGALKDGVTTWMPSFIMENFNLDASVSILTGVLLPLFSLVSYRIAQLLYIRYLHNELICASAFFLSSTVFVVLLTIFGGSNLILTITLFTLISGSMHAANLIQVSILPGQMAGSTNVSFLSGILNSCTYAGSAISVFGIAIISENFGWGITVWIWAGIALAGSLICFSFAKAWNKFKERGREENTVPQAR